MAGTKRDRWQGVARGASGGKGWAGRLVNGLPGSRVVECRVYSTTLLPYYPTTLHFTDSPLKFQKNDLVLALLAHTLRLVGTSPNFPDSRHDHFPISPSRKRSEAKRANVTVRGKEAGRR